MLVNIQYIHFALGLKDTIDEIQKDIGQRMYETCLRGNLPDPKDLLSRDDMVKLKRCIFAQGNNLYFIYFKTRPIGKLYV